MMKKLSAILLALVMVFSLTATAFAATVTVDESAILEGHSFTAYQVFAGREEGGVLSDVTAGSGVNFAAFLADLQAADDCFTSCVDAEDVAKVLSDNNTDSALAKTVAEIAYANKAGDGSALTAGDNNLADGYYLIVDTTNPVAAGSAYNKALLQVVGNDITIALKTDAPSVEKKVYENTKYTTNEGYGQGYNDVADYNMGDAVPFHLIGKIPNMTEYDKYMYVFHDSYSAGLDAPQNVEVYLSADKQLDDADVEVTNFFTYAGDTTARTFSLTCIDLKAVVAEKDADAQYVIVAYTAVLNQNAVVGLPGNPNAVYLEYANNPNWTVDSWKDGVDNDEDGDIDEEDEKDDQPTGKTPVDKVIVFTYKLDTTKIDGATANDATPTKLAGAEFVLYKVVDGVNQYAVLDANGKVTDWDAATLDENDKEVYPTNSKLTSAPETGLFQVTGLDDGIYYLKETKAPTGFNLLKDDVKVVVSAKTVNNQSWAFDPNEALIASTEGEYTVDIKTGTASITVENNKGATLPETGGMGTTILYVVGGALVLAAVVLLVSKKRMSEC